MLVLPIVALWFILRGDLFNVLPCVILFLCFPVLLALRLPRLGKRELILVLLVRFFGLCLFGLSVSSSSWCLEGLTFVIVALVDFSLTFFFFFKFHCSYARKIPLYPFLLFLKQRIKQTYFRPTCLFCQ